MEKLGYSYQKKYVSLAGWLKDAIRLKRLKSGERLPTVRRLVIQHKASISTVMHAIQLLEMEGWVRRVPGKGVFVCEPPSSSLSNSKTFLTDSTAEIVSQSKLNGACIGVACHEYPRDASLQNVCFDRLLRGAEYEIHSLDGRCQLFTVPANGNQTRAHPVIEAVGDHSVNAVIGIGGHWHGAQIKEISETLALMGVPLIQVYSDSYPGLMVHRVTVDSAAGMRLLARHLMELGHSRVCFLGWSDHGWSQERLEALQRALPQEPSVVTIPSHATNVRDLLRREIDLHVSTVTALVAANDRMAAMTIEILRDMGLRIPQEVSVSGFDDDYQFRGAHITTVGLPLEQVAASAVRLATFLLFNSTSAFVHETRLQPRLLIRNTTGPARRGSSNGTDLPPRPSVTTAKVSLTVQEGAAM